MYSLLFTSLKNCSRCHLNFYKKLFIMSKRNIIAVGQLTATNNKENNFEICKDIILKAAKQNAQMIFLPEACDYVGESKAETIQLAETLDGKLVNMYCELAKEHKVWLSLGGIHEAVSSNKVRNCHVLINSAGRIEACYRKTHLFDVEIPERQIRLMESDYVLPGNEIVTPVDTCIGKVGLGICYDLRFPEFSTVLAKMGADLLTFPSAFTFATGSAHWETLLRARAIENQCFVVAAAQVGNHNKKRSSWGHAMCVDPWGTVIAQCSENSRYVLADIDLSYIQQVRQSMPVMKHRRNDLYPVMEPLKANTPEDGSDIKHKRNDVYPVMEPLKANTPEDGSLKKTYDFGPVLISSEIVFYKTEYSIAFTNIRCVVPGHVLVMPIRKALRLGDLSSKEIGDLFCAVQKVQSIMEKVHQVTSSTIVVQDGKDAGRTIEHVHVHVLPRRPGDFDRNDDIYVKLQNEGIEQSPRRTEEEMTAEAIMLKNMFDVVGKSI